jgi:hypothetical protein
MAQDDISVDMGWAVQSTFVRTLDITSDHRLDEALALVNAKQTISTLAHAGAKKMRLTRPKYIPARPGELLAPVSYLPTGALIVP